MRSVHRGVGMRASLGICLVALFLLGAASVSAACRDGSAWSNDPVCGNDVLTLGYAGRVGYWLTGPRWRWEGFQLETFEIRVSRPLVGPYVAQTVGVAGVGWKWAFGKRRKHEIGIIAYPLSVSVAFERGNDHDDVVNSYGGVIGFAQDLVDEELDRPDEAFLDTRISYRYGWQGFHVETGLALPLLWRHEGGYAGAPAVDWFLGLGF
jgi:hypothetical protein